MHRIFHTMVLTCALILPSCHSDHDGHDHAAEGHDHAAEPADRAHTAQGSEKEGDTHSPDEIIFPAEKANAAGVVTSTVNPGPFSGVVHVSGKVMPASGEEATLSATAAGIVTLNRSVTEGAQVGKGTPVFTISTSAMPQGDVTRRATVELENARRQYERAEKLIADKLITRKEYDDAKSAYETARIAGEAVAAGSGRRGISVVAPIGGFVKECLVKDGDFVDVGQPMMTLSQNRKLYLRAEVPERDYSSLGRISSANFRTAYNDSVYSLAGMGGRIVALGKTSGSGAPFVPVTFEFDNIGSLIPGSYAEIYLLTAPRENVLSVPVQALTEEQGVFYVYIRTEKDCYLRREVITGDSDGRSIEIKSGLRPGDEVVTQGAVNVRLASASATIPAHTHNH